MKDLIYKKKGILGLDIGTELVKYVQLEEKGKLTKLIGYGKIEMPKNIIIEGIISEPEKLAGLIEKDLANPPWGNITAERVIAALPESKLFTRIIELPAISEKEIGEAIAYEVDQSIPVSSNDLYIDWQIIEETSKKVFVLVAAAPKSIVDSYMHLFELLGKEPLSLEISLSAISDALISKKYESKSVLIIDVGSATTNMAVYDKNIIVTGSHPVGFTSIAGSISTVLGVDSRRAKTILKTGITKDPKDKGSIVIKGEFKKVITEIERMIKYHSEKHEKKEISEILLCGGLGAMSGLSEYLTEMTGVKTTVGNPWSNISVYPLKPVPRNEAPMYATAIGLSLRGMKDE